MGFIAPAAPPVDIEEWKQQPPWGGSNRWRKTGCQRRRRPDRRLPAVHRQARDLRGGRCVRHLGVEHRPRRPGSSRQLVDRSDRLSEGRRLDDALGVRGARRGIHAPDVPVPATDRRHPLLAAPPHDPPAAVSRPHSVHARIDADSARRGALRGRPGLGKLPAAVRRRRGPRHGCRPPGHHRDRRTARFPCAPRPPRQGGLPERAPRTVRAPARRLPVSDREPDRRVAARARLHLARRCLVQAQQALPVRGGRDDQQHAVESVPRGEAPAVP
jgi:hypothetical protein